MFEISSLVQKINHTSFKKEVIVVVGAEDEKTMQCVLRALELDLCSFILLGKKKAIERHLEKIGKTNEQLMNIEIHDVKKNLARVAVQYIHEGKATMLMKGNVSTKELLQAVLSRKVGLRTEHLLSHVAVCKIPGREQPILLTDAAVNIAPSIHEKVEIVEHAVSIARLIGIELPKVAAIAPVDVIDESIPSTLDAAKLTELNRSGEIIDCQIGGPISFDNAISLETALYKESTYEISGKSDVLIVPTIEVGNALYKAFTFFAHAIVAGVVCGATVPIILPSRADSTDSKLYSVILGIAMKQDESIRELEKTE